MEPTNQNPYDPALRSLAGDLLGYLRLPGGTVANEFTYALFDLWGKADEENKEAIHEAWPLVAHILQANEHYGEDGLRRIFEN